VGALTALVFLLTLDDKGSSPPPWENAITAEDRDQDSVGHRWLQVDEITGEIHLRRIRRQPAVWRRSLSGAFELLVAAARGA
jgi:hypothetical protein